MCYDGTTNTLANIVEWLKSEYDDEDSWQDQTDDAHQCLAQMVDLAEPERDPSKRAGGHMIESPVGAQWNRAIPHVRAMLSAMRNRDWRTALTHGETAMKRMQG